MGGYGSGRRSGKRTTGDMWRLTIFYLHKRGLLTPGRSSSLTWSRNGEPVASIGIWAEADHIVLKYRTRPRGGKWEDKEYPVFLDWTACHLGGQRPWFLCPRCGRRVGVLYGGSIYDCRHCHNLVYTCQREAVHDRLLSRALKIRKRLGWDSDYGPKPKGMHWKTFERLRWEHSRFNGASWLAMAEKFGIEI